MRRPDRGSRRGITLIEVAIAIVVIAVLATILVPTILSNVERSRIEEARDMVNEVAKTFRRFHDDTSYWPYGASLWNPAPGQSAAVNPTGFTVNDTALFLLQPPVSPSGIPPLVACLTNGNPGGACWSGPYLGRGMSMADQKMIDPWGDTLYFTMQRQFDGFGGGTQAAPNGVVVIWSLGPDMLDDTGCTVNTNSPVGGSGTANCSVNYQCVASGCASTCVTTSLPTCSYPSSPPPDDIIKVAGTAI